jgi:hypothetical protein
VTRIAGAGVLPMPVRQLLDAYRYRIAWKLTNASKDGLLSPLAGIEPDRQPGHYNASVSGF